MTMGTTSAHAENTCAPPLRAYGCWNYLRARGEYLHPRFREPINLELPPRTRRILTSTLPKAKKIGTTSAHAENTIINELHATKNRNYLRARGEYPNPAAQTVPCKELPPRTRRIPPATRANAPIMGTTSAHAENTQASRPTPPGLWNYLRARGEYFSLGAD